MIHSRGTRIRWLAVAIVLLLVAALLVIGHLSSPSRTGGGAPTVVVPAVASSAPADTGGATMVVRGLVAGTPQPGVTTVGAPAVLLPASGPDNGRVSPGTPPGSVP